MDFRMHGATIKFGMHGATIKLRMHGATIKKFYMIYLAYSRKIPDSVPN
jgi:hypothetical protein